MDKIAYICDIPALGEAFLNEGYAEIRERVLSMSGDAVNLRSFNGEKYGYMIHVNKPLTSIYNFDVFMVDFIFSSVSRIHEEEQLEIMRSLICEIKEKIKASPGYYIFRIPTDLVDLVRAFNMCVESYYVCGGTVSYISDTGSGDCINLNDKVRIIADDVEYLKTHQREIAAIAEEAFSNYQGQYHISPVTADKADLIYVNWTSKVFDDDSQREKMIVAEIKGEIAGFWSYVEYPKLIHTGLTATRKKFRGEGVYKAMLSGVLGLCGKNMVIGTQFDNYIVQNTWVRYKMHPFNGFYTLHVDGR